MSCGTVWLTGLPGSGHKELSELLTKLIRESGRSVVLLDDENLRRTLSYDLGYTKYDWEKHTLRLVHACYLLTSNDVINIVSSVSPSRRVRNYGKSLIGNFIEILVKESSTRKLKREEGFGGDIRLDNKNKDYFGLDFDYEEPYRPDIIVDMNKETLETGIDKIIQEMMRRKLI